MKEPMNPIVTAARCLLVQATCLFVAVSVASSSAFAQASADPDWPCIQVLVPTLNTAIYWPVPIEESERGTWRQDDQVAPLARDLGDLESVEDEHRQRIEAFATGLAEEQLQPQLNRLVDGIVSVASERRGLFIKGIKRYTRQQGDMARQIETRLNELSRLQGDEDETLIASLRETLRWQERIYDQRERSIIALCDRPVEVEETLSEVLREVSQFLP